MCQSSVYALDSGRQELLVENVARLDVVGDQVTIEPLFGEQISLSARIKEMDLMKHRILVEII